GAEHREPAARMRDALDARVGEAREFVALAVEEHQAKLVGAADLRLELLARVALHGLAVDAVEPVDQRRALRALGRDHPDVLTADDAPDHRPGVAKRRRRRLKILLRGRKTISVSQLLLRIRTLNRRHKFLPPRAGTMRIKLEHVLVFRLEGR